MAMTDKKSLMVSHNVGTHHGQVAKSPYLGQKPEKVISVSSDRYESIQRFEPGVAKVVEQSKALKLMTSFMEHIKGLDLMLGFPSEMTFFWSMPWSLFDAWK